MAKYEAYIRDSTYVAQHMFKALKGRKPSSLTVEELEKILRDALANAHPQSKKYGGYVLYIP